MHSNASFPKFSYKGYLPCDARPEVHNRHVWKKNKKYIDADNGDVFEPQGRDGVDVHVVVEVDILAQLGKAGDVWSVFVEVTHVLCA